jgi:hypothetical protein
MKNIKSAVCVASLVLAMLFVSPAMVSASRGTVEMQSSNSAARCWAVSGINASLSYTVIVNCLDLIYPISTAKTAYVAWAKYITLPNQALGVIMGNKPSNYFKLGNLGQGFANFTTGKAFSEILITKEVNDAVGAPSSDVLMRGNVQPITFLEKPVPTATPTPTQTPTPAISKAPAATTSAKATGSGKSVVTIVLILFGTTIATVLAISIIRSRFS